jgi:hypothetical protein
MRVTAARYIERAAHVWKTRFRRMCLLLCHTALVAYHVDFWLAAGAAALVIALANQVTLVGLTPL